MKYGKRLYNALAFFFCYSYSFFFRFRPSGVSCSSATGVPPSIGFLDVAAGVVHRSEDGAFAPTFFFFLEGEMVLRDTLRYAAATWRLFSFFLLFFSPSALLDVIEECEIIKKMETLFLFGCYLLYQIEL